MVQSGTISANDAGSIASGDIATYPITFNPAFSTVPNVVVGFLTNADAGNFGRCYCAVRIEGLSTTGCSIRVFNGDAQSRTPRINWIATT